MAHVTHEFKSPVTLGAQETIDRFNSHLDNAPETIRVVIAQKALGMSRSGDTEVDYAITSLLEQKGQDDRLLPLGFGPETKREQIWAEVYRDENHRAARDKTGWARLELEEKLRSIADLPVDITERQRLEWEARANFSQEYVMQQRIHALGAFAHMHTPGYQLGYNPTDYIRRPASDLLVPHSQAA
jgi:hypothetical protein